MSEETQKSSAPMFVYVYGTSPDNQVDVQDTPLVRWLTGREVEITPGLLDAIRVEFQAQEQYRQTLLTEIESACRQMIEGHNANAPTLEHPVATVEAALWRGYGIGKFEVYSEASQVLSEIAKRAACGVAGS